MARESRPTAANTTPARQATASADLPLPPSTGRPTIPIRTPGSQGRTVRLQGLSASGRKPAPGPNATPHARAAFRTIDSRRAAIHTPHRARRRSVREVRETPRDFLLSLGKVLARTTEPIASSSSSPGGTQREASSDDNNATTHTNRRRRTGDTILEDEDEEELPKRPRLSLPIDVEDDDDDDSPLRPHRSAGLEDENFTVQSIELPRRAVSEQTGRPSLGSVRMSDYYFNANELRSEDVGIDSGFFPPTAAFDDNVEFDLEDRAEAFDRLDVGGGRPDVGRDSDFGIVVPEGIDGSTFMMAPQIQDSPTHQALDMGEPMFNELVDQRSDDYDDYEDGGGGDNDDEPVVQEGFIEDSPAPGNETSVLAGSDADATRTAGFDMAKREAKIRGKKLSRYGIEYPSLPVGVVKRLANTFAKTSGAKGKITPDALKAIMQASEWFFEQLGDDLQAFAKHAHRKTIDESDMLALMRRQRQINPQTTPFALAQRHLPRELLQELRMPPPGPPKKRKKTISGAEADDDVT